MRVVKVGGSLFDLPDLAVRLRPWVPALFVAGGGEMADAVRALHRIHALPEVVSHWLALRTCTLHAHFLAQLLDLPVVAHPRQGPGCLDAFAFCEADEANAHHLPHTWDATSDSLAARVAEVLRSTVPETELVLLKSTDGPLEALVDPVCPGILRRSGVPVRIVNLRV